MPDMHGVTKSHRRIGCIGSGRAKVANYLGKKVFNTLCAVKSLAGSKDARSSWRKVQLGLWTEGE